MNTRRNAAQRVEEEIANSPPLDEDMNDDQAPVNPTPLTDGHIRFSFVHMS